MRSLVEPPPSLHCELCHGELRFERIEPDDPAFDREVEIFVCVECGRVHSRRMIHDPYAAHTARRAVKWISRAKPTAIGARDVGSRIRPISSWTCREGVRAATTSSDSE